MHQQLSEHAKYFTQNKTVFTPVFFKLTNTTDRKNLEKLLNEQQGLMVYDEIEGQVEEWVKSINPKTVFKKEDLTKAAKDHLAKYPREEFGVWVYYPWSNRLIHILDEKEFIEVRTNRNQFKISPEEKEILSKKIIGVIGLSVGQSIALTVAMERICGELRLIDFDKLELSNFNRIRTGLHNLEVSKVVSVAREIAEFDPYLKVVCYPDGLTDDNMEDFFLKGGKMDACIEVCDGLEVKITSRFKARELGIPVVMNSSDKGTTDVERFDLNPNLPILHGLIDHLDLSKIREAKTNEEKVPYLLPMLGVETSSPRLKASMLEINQTITTWPQLASGVVLGGAICTDVCRRVLLNQFQESGRYFLDIESSIPGTKIIENTFEENSFGKAEALTEEVMLNLVKSVSLSSKENPIDLSRQLAESLIESAILAPTAGNCQPWKWQADSKNLYLFYDSVQANISYDFDFMPFIGLGAASENLVLKAHDLNLDVVIEKFPLKSDLRLVAIFRFFNKSDKNIEAESHEFDSLSRAIEKRTTSRKVGVDQSIQKEVFENLQKITSSINGAKLHLATTKDEISDLTDLIAKIDRIRMMNESDHSKFVEEIRWTPEENLSRPDGIDISSVDLTPLEEAGFRVSKDWKVINYLHEWNGGTGFEKWSRRVFPHSNAIGLITMPQNSALDFYNGGRAMQRFWLYATENNLFVHPNTTATVFFTRLIHGNEAGLTVPMKNELKDLRKQYVKIFSIKPDAGEIFLFRIFKAEAPSVRSLRRPIKDVLKFV